MSLDSHEVSPTPTDSAAPLASIPPQSLGGLFRRFLRMGALAWGGPVAQIGALQKELVDEERWVTREQFKRAYAVYQALPGPEATEMCVHFGMLARGRAGGVVAGLGFVLPGACAMLALSWLYTARGIDSPAWWAVFAAVQAAVLALIVRASHRIAGHALADVAGGAIAAGALVASLGGMHFAVVLTLSAAAHVCCTRARSAGLALVLALTLVALWQARQFAGDAERERPAAGATRLESPTGARDASPAALFASGVRAGSLTFGGAYTVIPYLKHDAVDDGGWLTQDQFLDGVALGGVLPAPLIIFSTFVGFVAGGLLGALAMTLGIFLPAFGITLLGQRALEHAMHHPSLQRVLAGISAGVVGLIAATALTLVPTCIVDGRSFAIFAAGLAVLYRWNSRWAVPAVVIAAGLCGSLFF